MNNQTLIQLFAEALEVDPATLAPDTRIEDIEEWGSIAWLTIMSMLDERFGIHLAAKQIRTFQTVGDVTSFLTTSHPSAAA